MTGQVLLRSDGGDVGLETAIALVNALVVATPDDAGRELRRVLSVDPPSIAKLGDDDVVAMVGLAGRLHAVVDHLNRGEIDVAAAAVNALLAEHSAHPHLAFESGRWRLHHHPPEADVVPMWTAITADALARAIGEDRTERIGRCAAHDCGRVFVDASKNHSRRFCTTTCQNRVKAAAFRRRRLGDGG